VCEACGRVVLALVFAALLLLCTQIQCTDCPWCVDAQRACMHVVARCATWFDPLLWHFLFDFRACIIHCIALHSTMQPVTRVMCFKRVFADLQALVLCACGAHTCMHCGRAQFTGCELVQFHSHSHSGVRV
jgi:hypothetical protein